MRLYLDRYELAFDKMASHYKVYLNITTPMEYCFMPSINMSTLGIIDQTVKYDNKTNDVSIGITILQYLYFFIIAAIGIIINGLIALVLMKNKKMRNEVITCAILSQVISNLLFCIFNLFPAGCKVDQMITLGLMLCSAFNLLGIGILRLIKLYFDEKVNENMFHRLCVFVAIFSWIFAFIVLLPTAIGKWGQIDIECNNESCVLINVNADGSNTGFSNAQLYLSCYVVIGISNIILNIVAYLKIQSYFQNIASDINSNLTMDLLRKEAKIARTMGADSALYAIFPIPLAILYFIDPYSTTTVPEITLTLYNLWVSTAIVEPLLLLKFQEKYRKEIKLIFRLAYSYIKNQLTMSCLK